MRDAVTRLGIAIYITRVTTVHGRIIALASVLKRAS